MDLREMIDWCEQCDEVDARDGLAGKHGNIYDCLRKAASRIEALEAEVAALKPVPVPVPVPVPEPEPAPVPDGIETVGDLKRAVFKAMTQTTIGSMWLALDRYATPVICASPVNPALPVVRDALIALRKAREVQG